MRTVNMPRFTVSASINSSVHQGLAASSNAAIGPRISHNCDTSTALDKITKRLPKGGRLRRIHLDYGQPAHFIWQAVVDLGLHVIGETAEHIGFQRLRQCRVSMTTCTSCGMLVSLRSAVPRDVDPTLRITPFDSPAACGFDHVARYSPRDMLECVPFSLGPSCQHTTLVHPFEEDPIHFLIDANMAQPCPNSYERS